MKKPKPRAKPLSTKVRRRTKVASTYVDEGPVTVEVAVSRGSAQSLWLQFSRKGYLGYAFMDVDEAEALHAQLGERIAAAKAELAQMAADHAADPDPDPAPPAA